MASLKENRDIKFISSPTSFTIWACKRSLPGSYIRSKGIKAARFQIDRHSAPHPIMAAVGANLFARFFDPKRYKTALITILLLDCIVLQLICHDEYELCYCTCIGMVMEYPALSGNVFQAYPQNSVSMLLIQFLRHDF